MTWATVPPATATGLINVRAFTSGSGTYTPTAGTNAIVLEMLGGGGGGGATAATGTLSVAAASGGNAGAHVLAYLTSGFSGVSFSVGVGGAGGVAGQNNGTAGGNTTFAAAGGTMTALGGTGGQGQGALAPPYIIGPANVSAVGSSGSINGAGGSGGYGIAIATGSLGGVGGAGGDTLFGQGGFAAVTTIGGHVANGFGAGGGGALGLASAAAQAGGNGAGGFILVYEYR